MGLVNFLIKIGLDTTDVNIGVKRVEGAFSGMGGTVKKALGGLFTIGAATAYSKTLLTVADNLTDMAETLGITRQELQSLEAAAASGGGSMEQLTQSLIKVTEARDKAMSGGVAGQKMLQSFAALGVSERDVLDKSLRHYDILTKISEKIGSSNTSFGEQTALIDIIGSKSAKLRNTLSDLSKETPITFITEEGLEALDKANRKTEALLINLRNYAAERLGGAIKDQENISKNLGGGAVATAVSGPFAVLGQFMEFVANAFGKTLDSENKRFNALTLPEKPTGKYDGPADISYVSGADFGPNANEKKKAEKESSQQILFRSSNPDSGAAGGNFYFGAEQSARLDLGRQSVDIQKQTLKEVQSANTTLRTLTTQ